MKVDRLKVDAQYENILSKVEELASMIMETEDYDCYQRRLGRIQARPDLYASFNEFRRRLMERRMEGVDEGLSVEVESLYKEYSVLLNEPMINSFLMAEQRVCELMRQVYDHLAGKLPLDYTYMNGEDYDESRG